MSFIGRPSIPLHRPWSVAVHLVLAGVLAVPLAAQAPPAPGAGSPSVASLLTRYGIRSIDPPSPASDFTLPNLAGGKTALSDYYGSWVVLTFFATWCGPCRHELPSLEEVHKERAAQGVVVLGVSVDDERAVLDPFVRQLGLSFPILWDAAKEVGAAYRATSIPISYLIDPEGRLTGVSRGARDWAALVPMLDAALAAMPATSILDQPVPTGAYADAGQPVATATVKDPPSAELALSTETPAAGESFHLDVHLRWAGSFEEYLPHPPQVLLPEGVLQEGVTAETSSEEGRNQLTYRITLRADEPGRYALDPVELRYTPRFESAPVASRVLGPTVEVREPTVSRPLLVGGAGAVLAFLGLSGWAVGRRLRRARITAEPSAEAIWTDYRERFEGARKLRLQGDSAACFLALAELVHELDARSGEEKADPATHGNPALDALVERARYGGEAPPGSELESLQREVERRIDQLRPDNEAAERRALRLRTSN